MAGKGLNRSPDHNKLGKLQCLMCFPPAVDCGSLANPRNGIVIGNSTFGSEVTYVCDQGYTISGNDSRVCQSNGEWNGTAPECEGLSHHTIMYAHLVLFCNSYDG